MTEQTDNRIRWHIQFEGEVQFVGFRYTARQLARKLGLTGWVKNLPDGRVEAEAQGSVVDLRRFLLQLKAQPHIRITHCTITPIEPVPKETRFSVTGSMD